MTPDKPTLSWGAVPLLPVAAAVVAGVLAQGLGFQGWWLLAPVAMAAVAVARDKGMWAVALACFALAAADAWVQSPRQPDASLWANEAVYSGVVVEARQRDASQQLVVEIDRCNGRDCRPFLAGVAIIDVERVARRADRVGFRAVLEPPGSVTDFPDDADPEARLRQRGVVAKAVVRDQDWLYCQPEPGLANDIRRWRSEVTRLITRSPISAGAMAFLNTTMTGDADMLPPDTRQVLSATGLAHILALSGLHVGILAWLVSLALFPLCTHRLRRVRLLLTLVAVWLFVLVTGMGASVARSAVMVSVLVLARILERRPQPLNSLCFAAVVVLVFDPRALYGIGFQLTFLAVAAISLIAPRLNPFDPRRHHYLHVAAQWLAVPVAAMIGTGVVSAYYFHIFPVYFLICNVATAFLLPLLLGAGVAMLCFTAAGSQALWLGEVVDFVYGIIIGLSRWVAGLPGAAMENVYLPLPAVWAFVAAVALLAAWLARRTWPLLGATLSLLVVAACLCRFMRPGFPQYEHHIMYENGYTGMAVRAGGTLWHFTTDARAERVGDVAEAEWRCAAFMARRGIGAFRQSGAQTRVPGFTRAGNVVSVPAGRYVFISGDAQAHAYPWPVRYAVFCRGFKGDVVRAARVVGADTVFLSRDLNVRRHDRYARELAQGGIPFKSLRRGYMRRGGGYIVSKAPCDSSSR